MVSALAVGFAVAGTLGIAVTVLPVDGIEDPRADVVLSLAALGLSYGVWTARYYVPYWALHLLVLAATALITCSLAFNPDAQTGTEFLYVLVGVYAFYVFSGVEAILQLLVAAACWLVVQQLRGLDEGWSEVTMMVVVAATIGVLTRRFAARGRALADELAREAVCDHLTGVLNRRGFQRRVEAELAEIGVGDSEFSLIVADLDRFKDINDRLGHLVGDMALQRVAALMTELARSEDQVARIGGEEFAVLLPGCTASGALAVAERIRAGVRDEFLERSVPLTISLGITSSHGEGKTWEQMLHEADQALYSAKELGRDRAVAHNHK